MPDYSYTARELSGNEIQGLLTAKSEREALGVLAAKNLFPVKIGLVETARVTADRKQQRVPVRILAVTFSQLADLLRSGVPLLRAIDLLARQSRHTGLKAVLNDVRDQVADGTRLGSAVESHPRVFSELTVSMIRAGEEGSFLEDSLQRISDFAERQEELKNRILGALAYPAFLMTTGVIIVLAMLVYFVPQFEPLFAQMAEADQLPWATTVLLGASKFVQNYWWLGIPAGAGIVWLVMQVANDAARRRQFDEIRLKLPAIGNVVRSLAVARFCRVLGTLLKNGVPLLPSLKISKDSCGNAVLSEAIATAADNVSSGKALAEPLARSGQFPPDVLEMVSVGEEANNLENVLIQIADRMERQTNRQLDLVVRLLEPLLLVMMAGVILFVVIGLMLPILSNSAAPS